MKLMYAVKYKLKYRSKYIFRDICTIYSYDDLKSAEADFNSDVKSLRLAFDSCVDDRFFYGRVELVKSDMTPSELSFTDKYNVEEIYGTYMQKGILKIGYLGR